MKSKGKATPERRAKFSPSTRTSALILVAITIILLIPFAGKAFNMDDPLFIWTAKHIQSHLADPYGFSVNWYGKMAPMWKITKNPPLASYYIALTAFVVGWSEPALHIAFLIPAIALVLGMYLLARLFCSRPIEAVLAAILTPVFLISATTLMCDVMMLAFWVWAIYLWVRGLETSRHRLLALAMLFVALSALTKYFGIALIPLLAVYSIYKIKRPGLWALHFLIPVAILAVYQIATKSLYGQGLLSDAGQYATWYNSGSDFGVLTKLVTGLAFTGGCVLTALFYAPMLWTRKGFVLGLILAVLAFVPFALKPFGAHHSQGPLWPAAMQLALLSIGGISLLALTIMDYARRKDALSLLLLMWVLGTFAFASVLNWSVNGRSILPMAPAVGILIMRRIESLRPRRGAYFYVPLVLAACASMLVAAMDYQFAGSGRKAAEQIAASYVGEARTVWFEGHWGFQYYMEKGGGKSIVFIGFKPNSGDVIVIPNNNTNMLIPAPDYPPLEMLDFTSRLKLSTMNRDVDAGFFSDAWGPLPFTIGGVPLEFYGIFEIP